MLNVGTQESASSDSTASDSTASALYPLTSELNMKLKQPKLFLYLYT